MSSVDLSWVLALEIALPFIILSIVLALTILAGRKKYKEAAKLLILSVKSNESRDKQAILDFQTQKLAVEEAEAKKNTKKIMNERKFLVRNLVSGLLDKNVEAISQLSQDLTRISAHYHSLELGNISPAETEVEQTSEAEEGLEEDVKVLKSEIKSLKQEVHVTLTTLNNIFKEFSSMFGEDDVPEGQMSVDQIITAMESFSGKKPIDDVVMSEDIEKAEKNAEQQSEQTDNNSHESDDESELDESSDESAEEKQQTADEDEVASLEKQLAENLDFPDDEKSDAEKSELDFSIDSAIDDIDSALDGLELDASDDDEPDWGDAFAESGDKMDTEPK